MSPRPKCPIPSARVWTGAVAALAGTLAIASPAQAKTITVTQGKSGKSYTLLKGDTLVVKLAENPSTGYAWKTITRPACLRAISSKYKPNKITSDTPLVGGGGKRTFTYRAKAKGKGTLKLVYKRSTEDGSGSAFSLRITVR